MTIFDDWLDGLLLTWFAKRNFKSQILNQIATKFMELKDCSNWLIATQIECSCRTFMCVPKEMVIRGYMVMRLVNMLGKRNLWGTNARD
jgi:hypothetical protein